eukprot:2584956-Amphidinium_carterae.1
MEEGKCGIRALPLEKLVVAVIQSRLYASLYFEKAHSSACHMQSLVAYHYRVKLSAPNSLLKFYSQNTSGI